MPGKLQTTLKKLDQVSAKNQIILRDFYAYMRSKDLKSEHHITNLLVLLISLDKFLGQDQNFTSINSREQILTFLDHQQKDGRWVKREHDAEGRHITSFNQNKRLLGIFFRWLFNRDKSEDHEKWETPPFLRIKTKRPLRDSPYGVNDIWQLDEVLTIVQHEPELRNQAIITLLWDLDARPHEITALKVKDIILNEQYGEGIIPSNTKTGGGPILLTSSFTYVRDWINKHPFNTEPNARLVCNLYTGAPIQPKTIWQVLNQLHDRINRLVESGSITDAQRRQKLEHLLRVKKWNPYCFRHSSISNDSDYLPDYALKKKARWSMNSQQGKRYIKQRMGDELKNKILEHSGIKLQTSRAVSVQRTCGRCGYVNKLESKYCEGKGCNYPLTQLALDEIKAAEKAKLQELVTAEIQVKDREINELRDQMKKMQQVEQRNYKSYDDLVEEVYQKAKEQMDDMSSEIRFFRNQFESYKEIFGPRPLTKTEREKVQKLKEQLNNPEH